MDKIYVDDLFDVAEHMYNLVSKTEEDVIFVGLYADAIAVIRELLNFEDVELFDIQIKPEHISGYFEEYYVSLDSDYSIWCYPAKDEDGNILNDDAFVVLIADDCNKKILDELNCDVALEVKYGGHKEKDALSCEHNCKCCEDSSVKVNEDTNESESTYISRTKDGKVSGFTKSWSNTDKDGTSYYSSFSHYGSNEDLVLEIAKKFGINV